MLYCENCDYYINEEDLIRPIDERYKKELCPYCLEEDYLIEPIEIKDAYVYLHRAVPKE